MWAMVYFRTLPQPLNELDDNFLDFFFEFANTYTVESVLHGYASQKEAKSKEVTKEELAELGYTDEDILNMNRD